MMPTSAGERHRTADLLLNHFLPGRPGGAAKGSERLQITRRQGLDPDLGWLHFTSGMPSGIAIVGSPVTASAWGSASASTWPQAVP